MGKYLLLFFEEKKPTKKRKTQFKFLKLPPGCERLYRAEASSFLLVSARVEGSCGLMWVTARKQIALAVAFKVILNTLCGRGGGWGGGGRKPSIQPL